MSLLNYVPPAPPVITPTPSLPADLVATGMEFNFWASVAICAIFFIGGYAIGRLTAWAS